MGLPTTGFGQRMALARETLGITQAELARRLDVHVTWVSKLERFTGSEDDPKGVRDPTHLPVSDLFRLCWTLGCSPWALLTGWDEAREISLGDETVTAGDLWDWTSWEAKRSFSDDARDNVWRTLAPPDHFPVSDDDVLRMYADLVARYEERVADDGSVEIVRVVTPQAEKALEALRQVIELTDEAIDAAYEDNER